MKEKRGSGEYSNRSPKVKGVKKLKMSSSKTKRGYVEVEKPWYHDHRSTKDG